MSALLEVRNLSAGYGMVEVLFDISLDVKQGEAVVVLGANGAGKTSLLRAITAMIAGRGEVIFDGVTLKRMSPDRRCRLGIAHVPQGRGTIVDLTVEENLRVGAYLRTDSDVDADISRWYEMFPRLGERRDQRAGSMSGGEQQMLAIARAFMARPRLVLLDEPSLGLAPLVTQELFATVSDIVAEEATSVLLVEQNANLALKFASRGYVLESGRIVGQGTADELRADNSIRDAYLGKS